MSAEKRLELLRKALLEDEQAQVARLQQDLSALRDELHNIKPTPEHLAPLMAKALDLAQESQKEEMAEALNAVVAEGVKKSVRADRDTFADALSPVIGVSIRKAIASALKAFNQAINQAVEYSLSPKGLRWRMEAARTGVPFAQLVMRQTLPYAIEEFFLIHNETGLLAAHASVDDAGKVDSDAVSAMLTAIQDFVRDSFSVGDGQLEEMEVGGRTVWVIAGSRMSFAVVVHGTPPESLRDELEQLLKEFHAEYAGLIEGFSGDREMLLPMLEQMEALVVEQLSDAREQSVESAGPEPAAKKIGRAVCVLLLFAVIGYWGWGKWQYYQVLDDIERRLLEREDVVLLEWESASGSVRAKGMFDPSLGAVDKEQWLPAGWLDDARWQFVPYRSSLPEAQAARLREQWAVPETIRLEWEGVRWKAVGTASLGWVRKMARLSSVGGFAPDIAEVEVSPEELSQWFESELPVGVSGQVSGSVLELSGYIPAAQESQLQRLLRGWLGESWLPIVSVDTAGLERGLGVQLQRIATEINAQKFEYATGLVMTPEGWASMEKVADLLIEWIEVVGPAVPAQLILEASASPLAKRRANKVKDLLMRRGVSKEMLVVSTDGSYSELAASDQVVGLRYEYGALGAFDVALEE